MLLSLLQVSRFTRLFRQLTDQVLLFLLHVTDWVGVLLQSVFGKCLTKSLVYQVEVTTNDNNETKKCIGITANEFKQKIPQPLEIVPDVKYSKWSWPRSNFRKASNKNSVSYVYRVIRTDPWKLGRPSSRNDDFLDRGLYNRAESYLPKETRGFWQAHMGRMF